MSTGIRLTKLLSRPPQLIGTFVAGDVESGFYNDLRAKPLGHGSPAGASAAVAAMTVDRRLTNAVSVAQLGIGAWQLSSAARDWLHVTAAASDWIAGEQDLDGRLAYLFPMSHTFHIDPPWYSAMAQGEAASLLVRASAALGRPELLDAAARAVRSLLDDRFGLVTKTPEGPVLQEYPTTPSSHALNGWISALWGLYDVGLALSAAEDEGLRSVGTQSKQAFDLGARTLAARLQYYDAGLNWSRYDLYPHRIVHVASPFYHRLHIEQLRAMARLCPDLSSFGQVAERWAAGAHSPISRAYGVGCKIAFRMLNPRRGPDAPSSVASRPAR
jgi:heparosan-N-sulfate-glucuronate 5-epimerase